MARANGIRLPYLVRGDIDGFFGLIVDNLVQFLVVSGLALLPLLLVALSH